MADQSGILELLIKLGVVGENDVKAANELLRETGGATEKLKVSTEDLGGEQRKTADLTQLLSHNHRALHGIMSLIGRETAPELGHALTGALYGPIGIALAVGYAFEAVRKHIAETNIELDAMGEKARQAFADVKGNLFDAIRNEEFSSEKVDKFFKHIDEQADEAKKRIENALALLKVQEGAEEQKNKADEADALAAIKLHGQTDKDYSKDQQAADERAVKDRYASANAVLKEQGEQAGADTAKKILKSRQAELDRLLMQMYPTGGISPEQQAIIDSMMGKLPQGDKLRQQYEKDKASGTVDYGEISRSAGMKTLEQTIEKAKKDLGLGEHGEMDKGGDAQIAADAKKKADEQADKVQKLKEKQASLIASGWDNPAAPSMAGQIEAAEKVQADLQSKSQIAAAKVKADQDYIQQTETALAALKLAADSQKKLQEEIDKYTKLVKDAQEAFAQSQAVADVNIGATKYVTQKGEQHGKDVGAGVDVEISRDISAGAGIHDKASHDAAVSQLRESQAMYRELIVEANAALAAHKTVAPEMLKALKDLCAENKDLNAKIVALANNK